MHGRLDTREIVDIGDTALSFSEVKAIATGNPLLIDKAEADAALSRLQRAERAHLRNQDALRHAIVDFEAEVARLTVFADAVDIAIARRQDTRGEKFTMTVDQMHHDKRADAGQHVKDILEREAAGLDGQLRGAVSLGQLGGFPVNADVHRSLSTTKITVSLEGAPGTTIELPVSSLRGANPVGLVTRLENRLTQLETRKANALADIEHARRQIAHARSSIGQPFPHFAELAAARERVREIDDALDRMAQQDRGRAGIPEQATDYAGGRHELKAQAERQQAKEADAARQAYARDERHTTAEREYQDAGPTADRDDSRRMQANRAAVAANQAYRAGDLDQARQLTDQAAALDPSRAELWHQHRQQITALQLVLDAQAARAEGDHQRAQELLGDAHQLDSRMPVIWDGDLPPAVLPAQPGRQVHAHGTVAPGPRNATGTSTAPAKTTRAATSPPAGTATQADPKTPQQPWPSSPARNQPQRPAPIPQADDTQPSMQPPAAATSHGPRARRGTTAGDPDASTELADNDQARWPAPNPHAARDSTAPGQQARHEATTSQEPPGRQHNAAIAQTEPGATGNPERPGTPSADWRDRIIHQARQPWQPGPSWPHHPALRGPAETHTPDAGIEPSR